MFRTRNASQNTAEFVLLDQLVKEDHLLRNITKKLAEKKSFFLQAEARYPALFTLFGPGF
ncbi:hypothetical protein B9C53_08685 [Bacillus velezensis]|nr:hypothetical protein B9C53_08685 [Bacillus velezensis]